MGQEKRCSSCNVPLKFSKMNAWHNDGTISQAHNPDHRLFFYHADGFDRLFGNVADLLGASIDSMIIDSKRKSTIDFLNTLISGPAGAIVRTFFRRRAYMMISAAAAMMGYGHFELRDFKRGKFIKVYSENPYSPSLIYAHLIAVFNFIERLPADLDIEEEGVGKLITVRRGKQFENEFPAAHVVYKAIPRKAGERHLERCPECDLPIDFRKYSWDLERGVMTDDESGRNMVLIGPDTIDLIFMELETTLGPKLNRAVVEGQCRYVKEELQERETTRGVGFLARQLALMGMGNLVDFKMDDEGLRVTVDNAAPYLMVAGLIKGIFEALTGMESEIEYQLGEDGTLFVEVG